MAMAPAAIPSAFSVTGIRICNERSAQCADTDGGIRANGGREVRRAAPGKRTLRNPNLRRDMFTSPVPGIHGTLSISDSRQPASTRISLVIQNECGAIVSRTKTSGELSPSA